MSIFQEFEKIRDRIGHEKYDAIENYLSSICDQNNIDIYFKEMNNIWSLPSDKWNSEVNKLKKKYNVILLDDVLYNEEEWVKYETWYNENYLHRNIEILGTWVSDYDDICCNAILKQDEIELANIIASYDETDIRYSIGNKDSELTDEFVKKSLKNLIYNSFNSYLELPKISECSKLLQSIYDDVCASDASMCHISNEDWENYYSDEYSKKDVEFLKEEVKKYNLDDVISFDDCGYMIVGYGNLEMSFNDDRNLNQTIENGAEL